MSSIGSNYLSNISLGIGGSSSSGGNNNGVFAFGVNVGGGSARKTPSLPPLMLTPSPSMKNNNRHVSAFNEVGHIRRYKILPPFIYRYIY